MNTFLIYITVFLLYIWPTAAQKTMQYQWDGQSFNTIVIDADEAFQINVTESDKNTISIKVNTEGEYADHTVLAFLEDENTLAVRTAIAPYYEMPNDKLAAHKVISIAIELSLPPEKKIQITSRLASLYIEGHHQNIQALLESGHCKASRFEGNASIKTTTGDIAIAALAHVSGIANSTYGRVINRLPKHKSFTIDAQSVNGDITLTIDP